MGTDHDRQSIPATDLPVTWAQLTERLDAFLAAWNQGGRPRIEEFLPDDPPTRRRVVLIELIKADMEYRTRQNERPRIEEYQTRFPELRDSLVPADLLFEEYRVRRRAGEEVDPDEYRSRFPQLTDAVGKLLDRAPRPPTYAEVRREPLKQSDTGDTIGEFQILRLLGKGAFAHVYLAWQPSLQRTVALKVSADRGSEPQTLAQLDHPNIVRVFDQRLLPQQQTSLLYMTFVAGGTLANVLEHVRGLPRERWSGGAYLTSVESTARANGVEPPPRTQVQDHIARMTWPELVARLGARVAAALDYSHDKGVLHRDVKPANILLTPDGQPQLADFNVGTSTLKEPGPEAVFGGSLPYMSPEHLEALHPYLPRKATEIDARSDIYELGMTLWELLAGTRPFAQEQFVGDLDLAIEALLESRRAGVPTEALTTLPPDCPPELARVLCKSLTPEPADRYATAGEFARDLELCLDPDAIALLRAQPGGWRALVRRSPATWIFVIGLTPNVIASILNIHYNLAAVIDSRPDAQPLFWMLVNVINGVFFPLGLSVFVAAVWPVARAVRRRERGEFVSKEEVSAARKRCLRLGTIAARTCVACWVAAGICWPLALDLLAGTLSVQAHLHFLASLTVCGMIAAVYPFFLVSAVGVRALLPPLLRHEPPTASERGEIHRLERALGRNLLLAAAVPLVGIAALVTIDTQDRASMLALTGMGLFGYVLAYLLDRQLRKDLVALSRTYFVG